MRFLLPIILVFVPSFGSKEHVLLQNLPDDEKSLLFELVKRLDKDGVYDDVGWMDKALSMRQCAVTTNTSSIIKRIDSENNGAKILTLHEDIETNEACADLCCKNKSCDLAVYENKGDRHCYLFQCGGKCLFGHHSSYISNSIMHLSKQAPTAADGSELDLINLDQDSDSMGSNKGGLFSTTTPAPATPAPTPAPYIRAHSVGLGGPHCERDLHCEDPNAVCNYHKCRCREGYYQKGHICRENCPPSNFGCLELGTLGRGPQCVSQSQVCDSVMQCADGSDEFNCPESGASPLRTWQQQQQQMPPAQKNQQQQQQPPSLPLPKQHQSYPQSFSQPHYDYSEQGMVASDPAQAHPSDTGSFQAFPQEEHRYGQGGDGSYTGYNSPPEQPRPPYLYPSDDQLQGAAFPSEAKGYPPASNSKYEHSASEQYSVKGAQGAPSKTAGSPLQQPLPSGRQQPAKVPQTFPKTGLSQGPSPASPQQAGPQPGPQAADSQHQYPLQPQQRQQQQKTDAQQLGLNTQSQHSQEKDGSQQGQHSSQPSASQHAFRQPASEQSFPRQPPPYQPARPQQNPATRVDSGGPAPQLPPASDSKAVLQPGNGVPSGPAPTQAGRSKVFMEGGGSVNSQRGDMPAHNFPALQQGVPPKNSPLSDSDGSNAPARVLNPDRPKSSGKSGSVASDHAEDNKPGNSSPDLADSHKPYAGPGHSKAESQASTAYHGPQASDKLESLHPHSAYDVRIGEPSSNRHQPNIGQQPFLNPTELNNLDAQGPSHFLDTFGNQYVPGQGYGPGYGQQYSQYGRYPNAFSQNSGSRVSGFSGLSDQLYPGGQAQGQGQGQRLYPQQNYLDLGYQSPQYEFGEFDPAYSETDNFPGSHDVASYHPSNKLGYGKHSVVDVAWSSLSPYICCAPSFWPL